MTDQTPDDSNEFEPPVYVDFDTLLKPRIEEHDFAIEGVGVVKVRALSRAEAHRAQRGDKKGNAVDLEVMERRLIRMAMVQPKLTEEQVAQWMKVSPGGELTRLVTFITDISGMKIEEAEKEAYKEFERRVGQIKSPRGEKTAMIEEAIKRKGCHTVVMRGREYKGYVHVNGDSIKNKKDFDYWIGLALDYNKIAKASKK